MINFENIVVDTEFGGGNFSHRSSVMPDGGIEMEGNLSGFQRVD